MSFRGTCICSLFDFRKLRIFRCFPFPENSGTPTFPISGNSGLRRFPIFLYYVITLISCLHLSLVTPSAVVNTSLSPDPQFPLALLYCFRLYNSDPILCTRYNFIPFLSYKYLYSVARISRIKITTPTTIPIHLVSRSPLLLEILKISLSLAYIIHLTCYSFSGSGNSHALSHSEIRDP